MRRSIFRVLLVAWVLLAGPALAAKSGVQRVATAPEIALWEVEGGYAAVREAVEFAITNRGLVVDHVQHIGDMLERTGRDVGATGQIYAKANAFQFCSSTLSRAAMEADPANIAFCPFIVFAYTLPAKPGKVYVGYRKPPVTGSAASKAALKRVETLLAEILQEAVSW